MPCRIDLAAGALVSLFGLLHLAVHYNVFIYPTQPRIWFAAGGFLLVTTGLANLAALHPGRASKARQRLVAPSQS
jgi:hypothetical protein